MSENKDSNREESSQEVDAKNTVATGPTGAVTLENNHFMDEKGRFFVPSYLSYQQTKNIADVTRNYQLPDYISLRTSVASKRKYQNSLGYADVLETLTFGERFILKFIGVFSSVQRIQVHRQCQLFKKRFKDHDESVSDAHIAKILRKLEVKSLILKNNFDRIEEDTNEKKIITCYTLDVEGYYYLKNYYGSSFKVNDPDRWFLWDRNAAFRHLRCWECVDIYQFFQSLPAFRGYNTLYAGRTDGIPSARGPLVCSTLQVSLNIIFPSKVTGMLNLVCYPCVQTDGIRFYKRVLDQWKNWLYSDDNGKRVSDKPIVNKRIPNLEPGYNALAFIVPDEDIANLLNTELKLYEFKQSMILFISLNSIQEKGALSAFMLPTEQHYDEESDTYDCQLRQLKLEELLTDANKVLARRKAAAK